MFEKKCTPVVLLALILAIQFLIVPSFSTHASEEDVIKIGATYPLSGDLSPFGRELKQGVKLGELLINEKRPGLDMEIAKWEGIPSLGGAKIDVVIEDDRADPSLGADLTKRLIQDENVIGMMGCYCSSVTKAASIVAEKAGIPFLNAASTSPTLTKRGYDWFWRSGPTDERNIEVLFDFFDQLSEEKGIPKEDLDNLAVASENTEFGSAATEQVKKQASNRTGYKIVKSLLYPHGSADLSGEVRSLLAKNPDVIQLNPYVADAILLVSSIRTQNADINILASNACATNPDFPDTLKEDAKGVLTMSGFVPKLGQSKPLAKDLDEIFQERFGGHLSGPSARVVLALQVWARALNKAGSTKPKAIQEALNEVEIQEPGTLMPFGVKFITTGNNKGQNKYAKRMLVQYQMSEGKDIPELEIIYPFKLATADFIYPYSDTIE